MTSDDAFHLQSSCSSPSGQSSLVPALCGFVSDADTVEVPVALLDMFMDTWRKYRKLDSLSTSEAKDADEIESCETQTSEPEPKKDMLSSGASSAGSTTADDMCSTQGSVTSPSASSFSEMPTSPCWSPRCARAVSPWGPRRTMPPRIGRAPSPQRIQQIQKEHPIQRRMSCPFVHANLPATSPMVVSMDVPAGCRAVSCTVQQTVTITNTLIFNR